MAFLRTPQTADPATHVRGGGLLLRAPEHGDYSAWADLRGASREHLVPFEPQWARDELSYGSYRRRLKQYQRDRAEDQSYAFFIIRDGDERLIGGLTLSNVRRGVSQSAALGYWIGQPFAGRGYMTEAVRTLLPHAFESLHLHRVEAACLAHNAASMRVLEKAGFEREGVARRYLKIDGRWQDHVLYAALEDGPRREGRS
jgi:ribosomal-protein-alanine N-acetyltransferase